MKPNYALNMTHDGIDLFERNGAEWHVLGTVSLESADMEGDLARLRRTAERRSPKGLMAKLIIPASQVLYTRIKAPGPTTAQRKRQIAHALDGRTPYAVSDLAFDWSGTGDEVMVAVVAQETLSEAEEFARTHGFAALSFVSQPSADQFAGEPWFGPTAMAAQYLDEGERVERDQDPVRVTGAVIDVEITATGVSEVETAGDADTNTETPNSDPALNVAAAPSEEDLAEEPRRAAEDVAQATAETAPQPESEYDDNWRAEIDETASDEIVATLDGPLSTSATPETVLAPEAPQLAEPIFAADLHAEADLQSAEAEAASQTAHQNLPEDAPYEDASLAASPSLAAPSVAEPVVDTRPADEQPAPAQHWLASASLEEPAEAVPAPSLNSAERRRSGGQEYDTDAKAAEALPADLPDNLPDSLLSEFGSPAPKAKPQAQPERENAPDAGAAAPLGKPIIARPTFAARRTSTAPQEAAHASTLGAAPVAAPDDTSRTTDTTSDTDHAPEQLADPALALPSEQVLSEAARAAIPRLTPAPMRIELPKSRAMAAPAAAQPSSQPSGESSGAAARVKQTAARKVEALGAAFGRATQSLAGRAAKLAQRGTAAGTGKPAKPEALNGTTEKTAEKLSMTGSALAATRRETPPLRARGHIAPLPETASDTNLNAELSTGQINNGPATVPPANLPPEPQDKAVSPLAGTGFAAAAPATEPKTAFALQAQAANGISPVEEAPFAADVEPLAEPDYPDPTPRARTVFGAPKAGPSQAQSKSGARKSAAAKMGLAEADTAKLGETPNLKRPPKLLMAKLVGVLALFMGGVVLWESYLGAESGSNLTQEAPVSAGLPRPDTVESAPALATQPQGAQQLADTAPAGTERSAGLSPVAGSEAERSEAQAIETPQAALTQTEQGASTAPEDTAPDGTAQTSTSSEAAPPALPFAQDRLATLATPPTTFQTTDPAASDPVTDLTQGQPDPAASTRSEIAPVIPTVSGTLTPSGTVIYAGRPPVIPSARPQSVTAAAAEAAAAAAFPNADPALKGQRPKQRPASVSEAAQTAAEAEQDAALASETLAGPQIEAAGTATTADAALSQEATAAPAEADPQAPAQTDAQQANTPALSEQERAEIATLLSKRPKIRPASVSTAATRAAEAAKAEAEAAAKAEEDARLAAEEEAKRFADATEQAVETSRRPAGKPRNIAAAVEAAVAAAVAATPREVPEPVRVAAAAAAAPAPVAAASAPAPAAAPYTPSPAPKPTVMSAPKAQAPAAAIDELDEPEPTGPAVKGATTATVAKQATEKNALNLGKVNLIGLFGSNNNRRALVRMSNGSFVRVKVGDRLDGGQVTAIGDGKLSYQKGGRNVTLELLAGG